MYCVLEISITILPRQLFIDNFEIISDREVKNFDELNCNFYNVSTLVSELVE